MSFDAITYTEVSKAKLPIGTILEGFPNNADWVPLNGQKLPVSTYGGLNALIGSVYNDAEVKQGLNDMVFNAQGAMREITTKEGVQLIGNITTQIVYAKTDNSGSGSTLNTQLITDSLFKRKDGANGLYGSIFTGGYNAGYSAPGQVVSVAYMGGRAFVYNDFYTWLNTSDTTYGTIQSFTMNGSDYQETSLAGTVASRPSNRRIMVAGGGTIILWDVNTANSNTWTGPLVSTNLGKTFATLPASGTVPSTFGPNLVFFNNKFLAMSNTADTRLFRTTAAAPTVWDAPATTGLPSDVYDYMKVVNGVLFIWKIGANVVYSSVDGTTFTSRTISTNGFLVDIGYVGGLWVAFYQYTGDAIQTKYYTSPDLSVWTTRNFPSALFFLGGRNFNGTNPMYFATAEDGSVGYLLTNSPHRYGFATNDGLTWTMNCYDPLPSDGSRSFGGQNNIGVDAVSAAGNHIFIFGAFSSIAETRSTRVKVSVDGKYWGFGFMPNTKVCGPNGGTRQPSTHKQYMPAVDYSNNTALFASYNITPSSSSTDVVQIHVQDANGNFYMSGFEGLQKNDRTSFNAIKHSTGDYIYAAGVMFKVLSDNSIVPLYFLNSSTIARFKLGAFQYSTTTPAVIFAGASTDGGGAYHDVDANVFFSSGDISTVAGWTRLATPDFAFDVGVGQANELTLAFTSNTNVNTVGRYTVSATTMVANGSTISCDSTFNSASKFVCAPIWTGNAYMFVYTGSDSRMYSRTAATWGGTLAAANFNATANGNNACNLIQTAVAGTVYALYTNVGQDVARILLRSTDNGVTWTAPITAPLSYGAIYQTTMPHYVDGGCYFFYNGVHFVDGTNLYSTAVNQTYNKYSSFPLNSNSTDNSAVPSVRMRPQWILRKTDTGDRLLVGFMHAFESGNAWFQNSGISCQTVVVSGKTSAIVGKSWWQDRLFTAVVNASSAMRYSSYGASVISGNDYVFWNKPTFVGMGPYATSAVGTIFMTSKSATYLVNGKLFIKPDTSTTGSITYFDETGSYTLSPLNSLNISSVSGSASNLFHTAAGIIALYTANGNQDRTTISFSLDGVKFDMAYTAPTNKRLSESMFVWQAVNQPNIVAIPMYYSTTAAFNALNMIQSWLVTTDGGKTWKDCPVESPIYQDKYGFAFGGQYQNSYVDVSGNFLSKDSTFTDLSGYVNTMSKAYKIFKKDALNLRLPTAGGRIIKAK